MAIEHGFNVIDCGYEIMTSHGMMTEEQLKAFNERERLQKEETYSRRITAQKGQHCPIRDASCNEKCALREKDSCRLSANEAEKDTEGMSCPFTNSRCGEGCKLYNKGCTLVIKGDN